MARTPFKLMSGNTIPFKQMASVPVVAPPSGGMAAPPPPPSAAPLPVSPGAVPQLKASIAQSKGHGKDNVDHSHPVTDDTYTKTDDTPGATVVSSPRLDAIEARLNKLKNTNTTGWSRSKLEKHSNDLKQGNEAREEALAANIEKRS